MTIACALSELAAGPGYRLGWWGLGLGLQTIRGAATVAAIMFSLALPGVGMALRRRMRRTVAVLPLRKGARNSTEYDAAAAARQRLGYPGITPAVLTLTAPQAFEHAERVARSMGWEIVTDDPTDLRIEATATTLLFGFKDDIVHPGHAQQQRQPGRRALTVSHRG